MSQDNLVKLKCVKCGEINYHTQRNKKKIQQKLEMKKHCSRCKAHTDHKEKGK